MSTHLSDADRAVVAEALAEIRAAPPPRDRAPMGCVIALPGLVLLLVFPVAGRLLGVGRGVATAALLVGFALLVAGLGLWFTAGGFVRGHATAAAEAALRALEAGGADREVLVRAATLLLMNAYATYGPTTSESFDRADARRRLGPVRGLVEAVERELVEQGATYPVFTPDDAG